MTKLPHARSLVPALLPALIFLATGIARADDTQVGRQSLDDAWWTGPIVAPSPVTLPRGHVYLEPYVYDVRTGGGDYIGSRSYMLYGLSDRLTVGLIPVIGYYQPGGGENATHMGFGDLTLHVRYGLTTFDPETYRPATAVSLEWTLPTGRHDRLDRLGHGVGGGAHVLTLGFYAQEIFWLPNGRLMRARIAITQALPGTARVVDRSTYGTPEGFVGTADPGNSFNLVTGWEYSLSRNWVLAFDVGYGHGGATRVAGTVGPDRFRARSDSSDTFLLAPAIEYNFSGSFGIIGGVRYISGDGAAPHSITPVMAFSMFF
ncbi:MAG: transporter [Alphaproteobacteria bacterium]|nr:MAG: transporter [Alphaproteobacteria bacterium]